MNEKCAKCGGFLRDEDFESALELTVLAGAGDWPGCGMAMACFKCKCRPTLAQVKARMIQVKALCDGLPTELRRELSPELEQLQECIDEIARLAEEEANRGKN